MITPKIGVFNTLPLALHHYEAELRSTLATVGPGSPDHLEAPSIELGILPGMPAKARRALAVALAASDNALNQYDVVLNLWPTFGLAEPGVWRFSRGARNSITVIHDPSPLRPQFGYGRFAGLVGRGCLNTSHRVVVHSRDAARVLERAGWPPPRVIRHPALPPRGHEHIRGEPFVLVAGQFKDARDMRLLWDLGATLPDLGLRGVIAGRGWPLVRGWDQLTGFLTEEELDGLLAEASCVVIPYRDFFVSNIGVRAAERWTPVVSVANEHTVDLWGRDWPGLVEAWADAPKWINAVTSVAQLSRASVGLRLEQYRQRAVADWAGILDDFNPFPGSRKA